MYPENWRENIRTNGYAFFPKLTPEHLTRAALEAIEHDLAENYDPQRKVEYDNISFCPDLRGSTVITDLLRRSPIWQILDEAIGTEKLDHDGGQIAIRQAHNWHEAVPPEPHIDGVPTPHNGLSGQEISNFTCLVGIFLSKTPREFAGNFTVWEGMHHDIEQYFRQRGQQAMDEGMPQIAFREPTQLMTDVGDTVLCHYQLAHAAAVNTSAVDRIAVYFRIWLRGIESDRWNYLVNIWDGWKI